MTNIFPYLIVPGAYVAYSNRGVCSNWNGVVAIGETKNKLSLRMKTALFTNLGYLLFSTGKVIGTYAGAVKN